MRQKWSFNVSAMIQKAECKSSDASSSWQTMLRGCLTVHAFLFFEPLPSAPVQHKHTHTPCSAHMLEVDVMSLFWPFSLTDVFMITFHLILPLPTPFLCVVISESTCSQYLLGDFLINHWSNVHAHTQTHTRSLFAHSSVFNGRPDSHSVTHAYKHIHTAAFWDWWLLRQLLCTTFLFNQSYKSICIYCHHSSCSHCVFLLQVCVAQLNVTTVSL